MRIPGGRWWAAAASVAVSVAMVNAQSRGVPAAGPVAALSAGLTAAPAMMPAAAPAAAPNGSGRAAADASNVADPKQAAMLVASAPSAAPDFQLPLSPGVAPEYKLQVHTIWVARAISMMFLDIKTIGGYRQDALKWHPNGLAIDVMIPNYHTPEGIELGNQIAGFALANAQRWGVLHVIWRQGFYPGIGAPSWTADYGNETANHFDHVHIATDGGGYPTGHETYYLGSMKSAP